MIQDKESHWPTVRQAAARGPLTERALRRGIREGWVPGVYIGNRFLINYERLIQVLEEKSNERVEGRKRA